MYAKLQRSRWIILLTALLTACVTRPTSTTPSLNVTITLANFEYTRQAYESLVAEFHAQYPSIEVRFVPLDRLAEGANVDQRQLASLADAMALPSVPQSTDANYFLDLQPQMDADPTFKADEFWPGSLAGCQSDGHAVGLPMGMSVNLILFDGAAFDAAGLPRPAPGWTWGDFQQAAQILAQRKGSQMGASLKLRAQTFQGNAYAAKGSA